MTAADVKHPVAPDVADEALWDTDNCALSYDYDPGAGVQAAVVVCPSHADDAYRATVTVTRILTGSGRGAFHVDASLPSDCAERTILTWIDPATGATRTKSIQRFVRAFVTLGEAVAWAAAQHPKGAS